MTWTDRGRLHAAGLTTAFLAVLVGVTTCLQAGGSRVDGEQSPRPQVEVVEPLANELLPLDI